jgi:hypothetical protein
LKFSNFVFLDESTDDRQPTVDVEVSDDSRDKGRLKAMVKPQPHILTHVIEGFVIQEGEQLKMKNPQLKLIFMFLHSL